MASRVYGDLAIGSGTTQAIAVGVTPLADAMFRNKHNPILPSVDTSPLTAWYFAQALYTPPTALPWGTGGSASRPTTGQLFP